MKYYLIKSVNNIPFILGQFDTREGAEAALSREKIDTRAGLQIVADVTRTTSTDVDDVLGDIMRVVE